MMNSNSIASALLLLAMALPAAGQEVLFEDSFDEKLSDRWQVVGLKMSDYRLRNGGLEMRVQPGALKGAPPMLKIVLPFNENDTAYATVKMTLIDEFTEEKEFAGIYLLDESGIEFGVKHERVDGKLVYAPGDYIFKGKPGEEGDPAKYDVKYTAVDPAAGPLRLLVDRGYAFFQVGPSADDKYLNFFYSAIRGDTEERGFALVAAGGPDDKPHWVRFDDFRVAWR